MRILTVARGYLPGYKYGGPVRSLAALVDQLGDRIEFRIVTSDSDLGEVEPYPGVQSDSWVHVGNAAVWYTQQRRLSPRFWRRRILETQPDVVYLNSFMDPINSAYLLWRRLSLVPHSPVVIAPRGELAVSALRIKPRRKRVFQRAAGLVGLHEGVVWQASTEYEAQDIYRALGTDIDLKIAPDLTNPSTSQSLVRTKQSGVANFIWIGRIAPVKNLHSAFEFLGSLTTGRATLTVVGPIEDGEYWRRCLQVAATLPESVTFQYYGELPHQEVSRVLAQHEFLLNPSHGENFGHVVAEAFGQGLPVLASDRTAWRNLQSACVGWDISLRNTDAWVELLAHCVAMDDDEYQSMSAKCLTYVGEWTTAHGGVEANESLFRYAMSKID